MNGYLGFVSYWIFPLEVRREIFGGGEVERMRENQRMRNLKILLLYIQCTANCTSGGNLPEKQHLKMHESARVCTGVGVG